MPPALVEEGPEGTLSVAHANGCPPLPQHDEVDILGLDGHIYKGRMDTRLPGILTKDSECPGGPETPQAPCSRVPGGLSSSWKAMGPLDPGCLLPLLPP